MSCRYDWTRRSDERKLDDTNVAGTDQKDEVEGSILDLLLLRLDCGAAFTTQLYLDNAGNGEEYQSDLDVSGLVSTGTMDMLVRRTNEAFQFRGPLWSEFRACNVVEFSLANEHEGIDALFHATAHASGLVCERKMRPDDITITLVAPRQLHGIMEFLEEEGYGPYELDDHPGIFRCARPCGFGGIQIVATDRLKGGEYPWLRQLQGTMTLDDLHRMAEDMGGIEESVVREMALESILGALMRHLDVARQIKGDKLVLTEILKILNPRIMKPAKPRIQTLKVDAMAEALAEAMREAKATAEAKAMAEEKQGS